MSKFIPFREKGSVGEFIDEYAILNQSIFHSRTKDWDAYTEPKFNIVNKEYERQLNEDYEAIEIINSKSQYYFKIKSGNNVGLLSSLLQPLFPTEYSNITVDVNSDIIRVAKFTSGSILVQYFDSNGDLLRSFQDESNIDDKFVWGDWNSKIENYLNNAFPLFYNNCCIFTYRGYKGILDLEGRYLIPPIYESLEIINETYVIACFKSKFGIICFKESILFDFTFDLMKNIGNNYVAVKKGKYEGVINVLSSNKLNLEEIKYFQTKKIEHFTYVSMHYCNHVFYSEGTILVSNKNGNEKEKYGYVDYEGNILIPMVYDDLSEFENGIAIASKNNKVGLIDKNNQPIQPLIFDEIQKTKNGYYVTLRNKKYGIIKPNGSALLQPKYTKIEFQERYSEYCFEVELNNLYNYVKLNGEWIYEEWNDRNEPGKDTYTRNELDDMYRDAFDGFDDAIWNID